MAAELYNGWYISANQYDIGPSSGSPTQYQLHNAQNIYDTFHALGWTDQAIAGMIGNIQYESCVDPACVYPKSSFPNSGASLSDISNVNAITRPNPAYGLVQWKGTTTTPPAGNQLVSYAIRYGFEWYDGEIQMNRLTWEYQEPAKFHPQTVDGVYWTFSSYASSTASPETLAIVWMKCYEGTDSVRNIRKNNARSWYEILSGSTPPVPVDWISGSAFADLALAYDGQYIPYSQADCIEFVNMVWRDINQLTANLNLTLGTNSIWRSTQVFPTTDPNNNTPTSELWYKDTIANCISLYGEIPPGALLFHKISDAGPPPIPPQYAGDGIGNFAHVGIYCGNDEVMQSGGQDAGTVPGGGVHKSSYDPSAWNYVAFVVYVDPYGFDPGPGPGPGPDFKEWFYPVMAWWANKNKGVKKNVRKYF